MDSDFILLESWRSGDEAAGQELFSRNFHLLARFFRNKTGDDYEDMVQETFLACINNPGRIAARSTFRAYILGVARYVLFGHFREAFKHRQVDDVDDVSLHDLDPRATSRLAQRAEEELLLQALRRLPFDDQLVLELRFWEDMRLREIGEVLQAPEGTVASRIRRAKSRLSRLLREIGNSKDLLERTSSGLETWAEAIRLRLSEEGAGSGKCTDIP